MERLPSISIVIPTYNCALLLPATFIALQNQDYPEESIERIIIDGGSTDETKTVARQYGWRIVDNPARSNLYGLPLAFSACRHDLILHLDDDNVLDRRDWLRRMVEPFVDPLVVAAEPMYYRAPAHENEITRYISLIGADDPLVVYSGFHDKWSALTNSWTGVPRREFDRGNYVAVEFINLARIPTLACNGFMARRAALLPAVRAPWLHIDGAVRMLRPGGRRWAKVRIGIVNHHATGLGNFWVKKWRRMMTRSKEAASFEYQYPLSAMALAKVILRCVTILPLLFDAARGWRRRPDPVWLLHPLLTIGTLAVYGAAYLRLRFTVTTMPRLINTVPHDHNS